MALQDLHILLERDLSTYEVDPEQKQNLRCGEFLQRYFEDGFQIDEI